MQIHTSSNIPHRSWKWGRMYLDILFLWNPDFHLSNVVATIWFGKKICWEVSIWKIVKSAIFQLKWQKSWEIVFFTDFQIGFSQRIFIQIKWLARHLKGKSLNFTKTKCSDTVDLISSFWVVYLRKYVFVMFKNFTYPQT